MDNTNDFDSDEENGKLEQLRKQILNNRKKRKYGLLASVKPKPKQKPKPKAKQTPQRKLSRKAPVSKRVLENKPVTRSQAKQHQFVPLQLDSDGSSESSDESSVEESDESSDVTSDVASEELGSFDTESDDSSDNSSDESSSDSLKDFIVDDEPSTKKRKLVKPCRNEWDSSDDDVPKHKLPNVVTSPQQLYSPKLNYVDFVSRKEKAERLIASREPCLSDIIDIDNITDEERATLLEQLYKLNTFTKFTEEHISARDKLWDKIKMFNSRKPVPEELTLNTTKLEDNLSDRIMNSHLPLEYKKIVYQKYLMLEKMNTANDEYNKLLVWILTALEIPFGKHSSLNINDNHYKFLDNVMKKLNDELYGMTDVKNEILMIVNNMLTNPVAHDRNIALIGQPGVGKTKIVRSLSSILNIPFYQISLGGVNNVGFIQGDSYAFIGAKCGKIVDALREMKCMNGIIFFDEIDKLADTAHGNEVSNALLHIIDSTQNKEFCDNYFSEFKIDLSKIWFIFSLNDETKIDHILRDRLNLIHIKGYSLEDKKHIFKEHLVPRELHNVGLVPSMVQFSNEAITYMINRVEKNSGGEKGVRTLMFKTANLVKRINLLRVLNENGDSKSSMSSLPFYISNFKLPRVISKKDMERLMSE